MSLSWVACNAADGAVLADLPDLWAERVSTVIGTYTSTTATLPVPTAPEGWVRATLPGAAFLVLLDDTGDGTDPVPLWGGLVLRRTRSLGDEVELSVASIESYLDRRYVHDRTFAGTAQTDIVRLLVTETATSFPIRVQAAASTVLRDRNYRDASDKTLLSVLSELSGVIAGPEWTVGWEHQTNPERYTPVLITADRLGSPAAPGMGPGATFEAPGPVTNVQFVEDYGDGKGATDVMAVSTASEDTRPQSPHQVAGTSERPPFEHRFTPSTSISQVSTLVQHAQAALAAMSDGAQALTLSAVVEDAPRLNRDWFLGDDVGYAVQAPAFPDGLSGVARSIGWEITFEEPPIVTPILATEEV